MITNFIHCNLEASRQKISKLIQGIISQLTFKTFFE